MATETIETVPTPAAAPVQPEGGASAAPVEGIVVAPAIPDEHSDLLAQTIQNTVAPVQPPTFWHKTSDMILDSYSMFTASLILQVLTLGVLVWVMADFVRRMLTKYRFDFLVQVLSLLTAIVFFIWQLVGGNLKEFINPERFFMIRVVMFFILGVWLTFTWKQITGMLSKKTHLRKDSK